MPLLIPKALRVQFELREDAEAQETFIAEFRLKKDSMKTALKMFLAPTLWIDSFDKSMKCCQIHLQVCFTVKSHRLKKKIQQRYSVL